MVSLKPKHKLHKLQEIFDSQISQRIPQSNLQKGKVDLQITICGLLIQTLRSWILFQDSTTLPVIEYFPYLFVL